jgi:hypothetical protein
VSVPFELRNRSGKEIRSPRGWGKRTKAGLARSWTSDHGLEALRLLLDEATGTAGFEVKRGVAGVQTSFDAFRGPHSHDLLLIGQAGGGITVVGIEGKGDESFGQKLGEHRSAARRKIGRNDRTNALDRMQGLTNAIAGWEAGADPRRLELRYQLFSAVAGTVAAAVDAQADQAVLCIHELLTKRIDEDKRKRNDKDLRDFIHAAFGKIVTGDDESWIVGPLRLHGGSERIPAAVPLYIAKLSTPPAAG